MIKAKTNDHQRVEHQARQPSIAQLDFEKETGLR
jgi:hypothetical protein